MIPKNKLLQEETAPPYEVKNTLSMAKEEGDEEVEEKVSKLRTNIETEDAIRKQVKAYS